MNARHNETHTQVLANMGENHNGNISLARQLVEVAISAGCDAVVLPHKRAEDSYTRETLAQPVPGGEHGSTTRLELLQRVQLTAENVKELREDCRGRLAFIGAPMDLGAFADLEAAEPDGYQVDPPVLGHIPLLHAVATTGRPVLLVAGTCTERDVTEAAAVLNPGQATVLHCVYGGQIELDETALWCIPHLRERLGIPVGYLGLEAGFYAALAAFGMGAHIIEKKFTCEKHLPGPGHAASLDRDELRTMVGTIRGLEQSASPEPARVLLPPEMTSADEHWASLVAVRDLPAGAILDESMLSVKLTSSGVHPRLMNQLLGRPLAYDLAADAPLTFGIVDGSAGP